MRFIDWKHLKKAKTNYLFHAATSLYYSFLGLLIFVMGLLHAVFPFLFGFTPYKIAKKITDGTEKYFLKK
jgi:hypothetical protein